MGFLDKVLRRVEQFITRTGREIVDSISQTRDETEDPISGWYLSGLQYSRDIGVIIYGRYGIDEAEGILRDYCERNVSNYQEGFYGIGEIGYDGYSPTDEVIEVGL